MVNYYKEEIKENGDICPSCSEGGFDVKIRKCNICGYNINHNTLNIIPNIKEKIEENIMTPEEITLEKKCFTESRGKERRDY